MSKQDILDLLSTVNDWVSAKQISQEVQSNLKNTSDSLKKLRSDNLVLVKTISGSGRSGVRYLYKGKGNSDNILKIIEEAHQLKGVNGDFLPLDTILLALIVNELRGGK